MIFLKKNQTNNFIVTLREESRLDNPTYVFEFINVFILNSEPIIWTSPDISNYTNRYNQFELIESISGSTTGGINTELSLIGGQYKYNVYESTGQTLSISATTGRLLESGLMVVETLLNFPEIPNTTNNNNTNNIYI